MLLLCRRTLTLAPGLARLAGLAVRLLGGLLLWGLLGRSARAAAALELLGGRRRLPGVVGLLGRLHPLGLVLGLLGLTAAGGLAPWRALLF